MGLDHRQVKDPAEGYLDMDGMEHFIMPCHDEAKCYLSSVPFNFPCFTSHPRSHQQFATLSQKDFDAYETLMAKGLERAIRTFKPDLLHIQHVWVASKLAADTGLPYVISCHGTDLMGFETMAQHLSMKGSCPTYIPSLQAMASLRTPCWLNVTNSV